MIQRVQSFYLLLAGIFPAITLFVPAIVYSECVAGCTKALSFDSISVVAGTWDGSQAGTTASLMWCGLSSLIFCLVSVILPLAAIFCYKNHRRQKTLSTLAVVSNVAWYIGPAFAYLDVLAFGGGEKYLGIGVIFPVLAIIALLRAKRGIKHDEELLRAADRLR